MTIDADTRDAEASVKVSVITIFLDEERFLSESIESVLRQDFRNPELILVDDGSSDASTEIALQYAGRHAGTVRYLQHRGHRNRGMSASRNLGLSCARGEYVAFLDADDVWETTKLTEQLAIMEAHPELGMVCGSVRYWFSWNGGRDLIAETGNVRNQVVQPPDAALALYPLGRASAPCPSDLLLRRSVVEALGGFEEHFLGPRQLYEDQGFLAKLYMTSPVYFSDKVWLNYRQHDNSCVSRVIADGHYHQIRLYFLTWLESYLHIGGHMDQSVLSALRKLLAGYRNPSKAPTGPYATPHFSNRALAAAYGHLEKPVAARPKK